MTEREPILVEREKTHGSFERNATIWREFCLLFNTNLNEAGFTAQHYLAIYMIFLKIVRIRDNCRHRDHWDDIAGYAKLGAEACDDNK